MTKNSVQKKQLPVKLAAGALALIGISAGWLLVRKKYKKSLATGDSPCSHNDQYPISMGSCGKNVLDLQKVLKDLGADLGNTGPNEDGIDGIFGEKTQQAVLKFTGQKVFP